MTTCGSALNAYESLAPAYDDLTAHHRYDEWLRQLEDLATRHGLAGRDVLDVACGTGKSFMPLLERGYRVVACDASPAMAAIARSKAPEVEIVVADMRELPFGEGRYDFVTCLDDALNHLPDEDALHDAVAAAAAALRPGGIYVFDLNTLRTFDEFMDVSWFQRSGERMFVWEPLPTEALGPGRHSHGVMHVFTEAADATFTHAEIVLSERHFAEDTVRDALAAAGLECHGPYGMQTDGSLYPRADERRDTKAIYVGRAPAAASERR